MSEHKNLASALLAFQAEAPSLAKDAVNPHFRNKYVSLDQITQTITPLLCRHGLVWTTLPGHHEGAPVLNYQLIHAATDEQIAGTMPLLLSKPDSQGLGSALTYARRYAISAVLGLSAEDDDGNGAARPQRAAPQPVARAVLPTVAAASAKQRGLLNGKAAEAELCPSDYANAILRAAGQEPREFESEDAAQQFVNRQLDRLPARLVTPVLEEIGRIGAAA